MIAAVDNLKFSDTKSCVAQIIYIIVLNEIKNCGNLLNKNINAVKKENNYSRH